MLNCVTNMRLLTLLGAVAILVCASQADSRAQDTNTSPTPASATDSCSRCVSDTVDHSKCIR